MKDSELLRSYIDAAKESTDRTRKILLIMVVASILIGTACWNTRSSGWVNSRLEMAKAIDDILVKQEGKQASEVEGTNPVSEPSKGDGQEILYKNAEAYIKKYGRTPNQASAGLFWAQKVRTEQISQIEVPFLGISFDVNDLGLLGGFTFIVMLIWVNYSLWHQSNNLKLVFSFARQVDADEKHQDNRWLSFAYQDLAMRQVLTIPPRPETIKKADPKARRLWMRKLSKSLYALPLAVQTAVVLHDWYTSDIGTELNRWATLTVLIAESLFLVFISILTVTCFIRWKDTFETWRSAAKDL